MLALAVVLVISGFRRATIQAALADGLDQFFLEVPADAFQMRHRGHEAVLGMVRILISVGADLGADQPVVCGLVVVVAHPGLPEA